MLLTIVLPLSLAFIMFALGSGLTLADFARVARRPKAILTGLLAQMLLLPVVAFALVRFFGMDGALAVGVMILSFAPGGVTSNMMTKLAGGALAVSISLTAIVSLLSVLTVPWLVAWSADTFMGTAAPVIDVTMLALSMFAITAVPVGLGVGLRHFAPDVTSRAEPWFTRIATVLFVVIVLGALAANWALFTDNLATLGPVAVVLNIVLLALGYGISTVLGLARDERIAVAIETGVQNASLGITVGSLIVEAGSGLPPFSLPSGVYGLTMYAVTLPFVFWIRRRDTV